MNADLFCWKFSTETIVILKFSLKSRLWIMSDSYIKLRTSTYHLPVLADCYLATAWIFFHFYSADQCPLKAIERFLDSTRLDGALNFALNAIGQSSAFVMLHYVRSWYALASVQSIDQAKDWAKSRTKDRKRPQCNWSLKAKHWTHANFLVELVWLRILLSVLCLALSAILPIMARTPYYRSGHRPSLAWRLPADFVVRFL